jgi:23S rRNA (uracil747-C5)-methyltransferase
VPARRGELKHLIVTASPDEELMVRFVLRSTEPVARVRKHLPTLLAALPGVRVVSVNVQPRHAAVLEGPDEQLLHGETLTLRINDLALHLRPQGFFQTNTSIASALYREAADWAGRLRPERVWDLYCGIGGFALHLAGPARRVHGVEVSEQAVLAARRSAREAGLDGVGFEAADATGWAAGRDEHPDLVVVNPPRRGIGPDLAAALEAGTSRHLLYSSCNPASLARDLAAMPTLVPVRARVFDMFPQTSHQEVLVLCERR